MRAKSKAKKLRIDDIWAFLERQDDSESDYSFTEIESDQESSSCGEYESCDEQSDLESSDILPQNIPPDTEEYHFQWIKCDSDHWKLITTEGVKTISWRGSPEIIYVTRASEQVNRILILYVYYKDRPINFLRLKMTSDISQKVASFDLRIVLTLKRKNVKLII